MAGSGRDEGANRARILKALDERPRKANRLAEDTGLADQTVRHHLDEFEQNAVVTSIDEDYGTVYLPSDRVRNNWPTVEEIIDQVELP